MNAPSEPLERILLDLSSRFANVPADQIRLEIEHGLGAVARFLHADDYGLMEPVDDVEGLWVTTVHAQHGAGALESLPERWSLDLKELRLGDLIVRHGTSVPSDDVRTSIVVPIHVGGRILGALSFHSSSSPSLASPEHLEQLRGIAGVFAHGLQRRQAERQLEDSQTFEQLLVDLTSILSRAPPPAMDSALAEAMRHLAQALRLEQVSLFELASGGGEPRTICGSSAATHLPTLLPVGKQLEKLNGRLLLGEVVRLAENRVLETEESAPVDGPSLVLMPLSISGTALCAVRATSRRERRAPARMVSQLRLAGRILASEWARSKTRGESPTFASAESSSRPEAVYVRERLASEHIIEGVVGRSDVLRYVLFKVDQVARTDVTTLLLGETGTGKSLIALAIHERSSRHGRALVTVNCAALPHGLVEAELFGHEKGSYTGAHRSQPGRFEMADKSTILLDEIGDLPLDLQAKLLRILQEGELERVGGTKTLKVNVRLIAATNRNLEEEVRQRRFREDLYYRLNVFPITLPTLRERRDDIPLLVRHFVERLSVKLGKPIERIPDAVMEALQVHAWPGNVRELESVLTRALIVASDTTLRLAHRLAPAQEGQATAGTRLSEVERAHISRILTRHDWRIEGRGGAASALGLNPSTLRGRMRKLRIQRPSEPLQR